MITRRKTGLLLVVLLGCFAIAGFVQWSSWPDDASAFIDTEPGPGDGGPDALSPPDALTTIDNVLLVYADGMAHVAGRYLDAERYETAIVLLERVVRVRRGVLGSEDHSVVEAQQLHTDAVRAHAMQGAGPAGLGDVGSE